MESIREKLLKIKALSDKGYAGEAKNAKELLERLLHKYGFTLDDLAQDDLKERMFKVPLNTSGVFYGILYSVIGKRAEESWYYKGRKTEHYCNLTDLEYLEVSSMLEFHEKQLRKEYKKQQRAVLVAYINKHQLTVPRENDENDNRPKMSREEMLRILATIDSLDDVYYRKQLTTK